MTVPEAVRTSQKVAGGVLGHQALVETLASESSALSIPGWTSSQLLVDLVVEVAAQRRVGDDVGGDESEQGRGARREQQPQPERHQGCGSRRT